MTHPLTELLINALASGPSDFEKSAKTFTNAFVEEVNSAERQEIKINRTKVKRVTKVSSTKDTAVYDISMAHPKNHFFFANDVLVHNSTYYSAYPALKDDIDSGELTWNKDTAIEVYNTISNQVSDTFPDFLKDTFNIPFEKSVGIIVSSREIVAESALFIKKKRYAALVYDDEGQRKDINGSIGKVKAMGLDLRRSDTPRFVQKFLMDVLTDTLLYKGEDHVIGLIKDFKQEFDAMKPWEKGTPKAVNGLTKYKDKRDFALHAKMQGRKVQLTIPGHVQASLNWNLLREVNNDHHTGPIVDAQKIIVCKLKQTADNVMTSVAYPIDESHLPDWFLDLPFDEDAMREAIVDQKIRNLLGVLNWDLDRANKEMAHMESLFDFG